MQKALIALLAIATAALAFVCISQRKQLQAQTEQARALQQEVRVETESRNAAAARVKELERTEAQLEKQVKEFTTVTATLRASEAAKTSNVTAMAQQIAAVRKGSQNGSAADAESSGEGLGKGMGDMIGKMMKDPAMREMMRDQQRAAIKMMYSGLFKDLKLTPEEKDKFTGLLTDAQMRNVGAAQGILGGAKDGDMDNVQKQIETAKKQTDDEIKALLGDDRFATYTDYQKNIQERMQLDQLGARFREANIPLQDQQSAQLLQIMKEEKATVPPVISSDANETGKNLKTMMSPEAIEQQAKWLDDYNKRVATRASFILSPEQMKQYEEFQDQQASMQKLGLKMARQMFGNEKKTEPAK